MEHCWNDTEKGQQKYWQENLSHCWNDSEMGHPKYWQENLSHCWNDSEKGQPKYWQENLCHCWNDSEMGQPKYWQKTSLTATLSTATLIPTCPGSNPFLRGERPARNCPSHGTAGASE
jgi:hypothetical protein